MLTPFSELRLLQSLPKARPSGSMKAREETTERLLAQQGAPVLPALPALEAGVAPAAQAALV